MNRCLILLLSLCCSIPAFGQNDPFADPPKKAEPNPTLTQKVEMSFRDAALADVTNFLLDALDGDINIVVHQSVADLTLSMQSKGLSLTSTLNLMEKLVDGMDILVETENGFLPATEGGLAMLGPKQPVVLFFAPSEKGEQEGLETYVYYMGNILNEKALIDDVAASIETAWKMQRQGGEMLLKFHEETRMLILKASPGLLGIADQIIAQLPGGDQVLMQALLTRPGDEHLERFRFLRESPNYQAREVEEQYQRKLNDMEHEVRNMEERYERELEATRRTLGKLQERREELEAINRKLKVEVNDLRRPPRAIPKQP